MQTSENFVIRTQGLSKSYQGVNALKPLDLHVARHSIFGFLGPNGAGKSTTIKLLLGLAKPTSGSATIAGGMDHPGDRHRGADGAVPGRGAVAVWARGVLIRIS